MSSSNRLIGKTLKQNFLDAGIRFPRGFFQGNTEDFGNYHQCLGIDLPFEGTNVGGKYCVIRVPVSQDLDLPGLSAAADSIDLKSLKLGADFELILEKYYTVIKAYRVLSGFGLDDR
ncbi:unnamed protein product, partial [Iphiclides podalirius]